MLRIAPFAFGLVLGVGSLSVRAAEFVTIPEALRKSCRIDADCVKVEVDCSHCCSEDAVAAKQKSKFDALYATTCKAYSGSVCDCAPAPTDAKCMKSRCQLVPAKSN